MVLRQIFLNGKVITMNSKAPEATAFGVIGDRFWAVGSDDEIRKLADNQAEVVDLAGKTVAPGLIESHNHMSMYATTMLQADCSPNTNQSIEDVKGKIRELADRTKPDHWVKGWGYDDTLISDNRHLTRADLDEVSKQRPVFILHVSAHLAYVNSKALEIADVGPQTPQPDGGEIHKDENGVPTGLLLEPGAINLVGQHIPSYTVSEFKEVLPKAIRHYHQFGITGTHDAAIGYGGEAGEVCRAYRELEAEGKLNLRVYLTIIEEQYQRLFELGLGTGFGSNFLKLGGVKLFQDGSIQALTAALTDGYLNKPDLKGDLILSQEVLNDLVEKYHSAGLQIAVHANGDRAIESVLQALERAQHLHPRNDHRHMLIHCQLASDDHIRRMKKLGVIPSYFVNHVYYWGDRHASLFLGPERAQRIDPLGSSMKEGLMFSLHSDLPVTPVDPIFSIHNAVNRTTRSGKLLGPAERISVFEALKTYTINAAYCSFEESIKGSIEEGKLADFAVLSENPLTVESGAIKDIRVEATTVGGRLVYGSY
jgi:predicted amidohydrolase YtcJ